MLRSRFNSRFLADLRFWCHLRDVLELVSKRTCPNFFKPKFGGHASGCWFNQSHGIIISRHILKISIYYKSWFIGYFCQYNWFNRIVWNDGVIDVWVCAAFGLPPKENWAIVWGAGFSLSLSLFLYYDSYWL